MSREIKSLRNAISSKKTVSDDYKDRLVKLIPSEIIAAYVTFSNLIDGFTEDNNLSNRSRLLWIVIVLLIVLTPIYLRVVTGVLKSKQLILSTFAFLIWALATNSPYNEKILGFPFELIIAMVLIFYTLLIPILYKGE